MKRRSQLFWLLLWCFAFAAGAVQAQGEGRLSFGVISDIHFENNVGEGAMVKVPRALKNLTSHGALDALAVVGDLADSGNANQYELLTSVFTDKTNFANPVGTFLFMMGNHDNMSATGKQNYQEGLKAFNGGENYPLHQYKVIKGYPFITISQSNSAAQDMSSAQNGTEAYPEDVVQQLDAWMAQASQECPGKPIFVFTHVPPRWTVYGSWAEYETGNAWAMKVLNPVLNKYPQAVVFAGHSHYPLGDPRSIHQGANPNSERQNYYTVINTGSSTYSEVNPGAVAVGTHPEGYALVTEGMIVSELPNGDIDICRYDTYRDLEIGAEHHWVLKAPFDGSMFEYADIRDADDNPLNVPLRNGLPAPAFTKSAEIQVKPMAFEATAFIPQATDNECVFRYRIRLSKEGLVLSEKYIFSQFYLNTDTPDPLFYSVRNLTSNTNYEIEVVAYDSYGNASEPLKKTFSTPVADDDNVLPEPDGQWTFEDAGNLLTPVQGSMTMLPCVVGKKTISDAESLEAAGIVPASGPTESNNAILVPQNTALKVSRATGIPTLDYTIMMDVKVENAALYNSLLQTSSANTNDGDLFFCQNKIGMNAMGGYFGEIKNQTWYRVVMVARDGQIYVYVNGELTIKCASQSRWEIDPWGFYLFCDEDGEMTDTEVAEVAYWERSLSDNQVRKLSGLDIIEEPVEPSVTLKTSIVKLMDEEVEFSVKVEANAPFGFDYPEWIEPVDIVPFAGEKDYTFRAQPMEWSGRREGIIALTGEGVGSQEVQVVQVFMGGDIPDALGAWTFDDTSDLLNNDGQTADLKGGIKGSEGPEITLTLADANIQPVAGPTEENGAISIPKDSYLWLTPNADTETLTDYTILYDIKPADLNGYKSLFQSDITNKEDAGLFFKGNQVGRGGAFGYVGNLQLDKWYRLIFVVKNGLGTLYLDGEKIAETTSPSKYWPITTQALLFADNDGEEGTIELATLRFWDLPLSAAQAKRLGDVYKDVEEYFVVHTKAVRLLEKNEFSITVNSNVPFTFDYPEWIEPVDAEFASGEKAYTFRAQPLAEVGRREGCITVKAEYFPEEEVKVTQIVVGEEVPEAMGIWTFDDPANLMAGEGISTLQAAYKTDDGPALTLDPAEAGIVPVEGPLESNGAVSMPVEGYLMMTTNLAATELTDFTVLFDVKPEALVGYHALLQTNPSNNSDGAFFIKNDMVGLTSNGLGYKGLLQQGKWHRIVFVAKDGFAYTYIDGKRVGQSTTTNFQLWTMKAQALLFADNNDEDGYNEVAEVRFWDVPLTDAHVELLGAVKQNWDDDPMDEPVSVWTFDNPSDLLAGTGTAVLRAAVKGEDKAPVATDDLAAAGIVPVAGPTKTNGAITVPINSYLQLAHNQNGGDQRTFTFMMDIRPKVLGVYNVLFQSNVLNNTDASLFINKQNKLGINTSGLGYGGVIEEGKWHRIIFAVDECSITTYIDGQKIGSSTSANSDKWILHDVAYFFADEDGEEGVVDIAELRYWNVALAGIFAQELGGVETETAIADINSKRTSEAIYDLSGRRVSNVLSPNTKLAKGLYIVNGKKVLIK